MTDSRIFDLTAGTPASTDVIPYTNGTTTYKVAFNNTKSAIMGNEDFVINYIIGNAGTTAITQTGRYPSFSTNVAGSFTGMEMISGTILGNATIDIWKGNYGTPPTGTAQSIIGTILPAFTGGSKYQGTIANWGTSTFVVGDYFAINLSGVGTIAGCYVLDGKIGRNSDVRIIRDGIVLHEGKLNSLKRFKDDAKEVLQGFECGLSIEKFNDIKENDIVEAFTMEEIKR